jgi:hypothetical protein
MAKQLVYRGGAPNDGQGDSIYNAFKKVNENFDELYSAFGTFSSNNVAIANNILIGNSSVNAVVNSSLIEFKNGNTITIAPPSITIGNSTVNSTISSASLRFGNTTINNQINSVSIKIYGSVGNATVNSSMIQISNTSSGAVANLQPGLLTIGTNQINSTSITGSVVNVASNTLYLGTRSVAANGYSRLPNGLLYQWGKVSANSSNSVITFSTAFDTVYSITVTPSSSTFDNSYFTMVVGSNTTTANVKTSNATSINVYYTAIGV